MAKVADFSVEEKLTSLVKLQKVDCKLDEIQILKGELPIEVKDLENEKNSRLQELNDLEHRRIEYLNMMKEIGISSKKLNPPLYI